MNKFILTLISSPVLIASILSMTVMVNHAQAIEPEVKNTDKLSCIRNKHKVGLVCARASVLAQVPNYEPEIEFSQEDAPMLEFNDAESDIAITLFGCDCPACINSFRQMRGATPLVY
ncbi:hypothetical protein ACN23B_08720 [Anabaena sp. FACHB-709]|uniref:HMA domain-containing protein n=2 Tax=Nostocaceae TaxID=1162 RepID=A0A1Z4KEH6_ANAVA|nr:MULTISPECIES: hypothetical protein [Nostocaceae]BAY67365.1 hypothetical protein NIES23_01380 [Trichormus variabilis NIES-23]HBW30851.1 hypothetical protein [Nostoc sp. UBA8866]MBD2173308.1 hypothetical protein [Anabaena cylindrica FACHB-318]MBD2265059.1 hypothetical protein [Anabaena sp. FACHB-709]MBD2274369.1 hypothetical protein [Nostoc sp. PCC 7120 = FACHB-418]